MSITINGATNTISSTGTVTLPTVAGVTSLGNTALGDAEASDTHAIKGATTLLANSASAALTVTQTGAGNAFVVEDSASTDSTPFVIDSAGNVGIGGAAGGDTSVQLSSNITGATSAYGFRNLQTVQSGVTTNAFAYISSPGTAAAAFTLTNLHHFNATPNTFGASSAVTNQYGFTASSSLTGATNNYGFYSNIASAANSYNFYASGTAPNYFGGNVTVGGGGTLGYGAGSGGTVTQATSKSTSVTLNKPSGQITMDAAALAAGASVTFIVNNSTVTYADITTVNLVGGVSSSANYRIENENTNTGLFRVRVTNLSAGSLSESAVLNFCVIKGSIT